ncbi:hypothetical protein ACG2LH_16645 [Zhouia sp. PK063]|uniref:hypothetical protein n=1 Tax=Zhouia sp. PK063 TaxID=3373602 RepID=UPI0037A561C5
MKGSDRVINIQGSNDALHIHEIKHTALSSNGLLDEIAGYIAQYGYEPSSLPSSVSSGINLEYIADLKKRGVHLFIQF